MQSHSKQLWITVDLGLEKEDAPPLRSYGAFQGRNLELDGATSCA